MGHAACILSGLIYVIGGSTSAEGSVLSSVYRFDPAANAWSVVAPMNTPRVGMSSFVLGGNLCVAGGFNGVAGSSSVERYNVASGSWEMVSDMMLSSARCDFGAQVMRLELGLFDSLEMKARRARN